MDRSIFLFKKFSLPKIQTFFIGKGVIIMSKLPGSPVPCWPLYRRSWCPAEQWRSPTSSPSLGRVVNSDPAMTYVSVRKERFSHELIFEKRRVRDQSDYFRPGPRDRLVRRQIRPEYRQIRIGKTGAGASFSAVLPHDRPEPPISGMQGYPGAAFGLP